MTINVRQANVFRIILRKSAAAERGAMGGQAQMTNRFWAGLAAVAITLSLTGAPASAQQPAAAAVKVNAHEIGGAVTSTKGSEAGVLVIAETSDLPTRFIN